MENINTKQQTEYERIYHLFEQQTEQNRMIDYLEDCNPAIRNLAYMNLMIA